MTVLEELQRGDDFLFLRLRFGGGISSNISPLDTNTSECADGENFDLVTDSAVFKNRPSFDLLGTAPNASQVHGIIEFIKSDGTPSMLVQAGNTVYDVDGSASFSSVGTVSPNARLRGGRRSTSGLDDKVIITDLAKQEVVKTYNGTTFEDLTTNLGATLKAKYCEVDNERAIFANVKSGASDTPHLLVVSKRSDITDISTANRPTSSMGDDAAFFLPTPDLKSINGLASFKGDSILSTESGKIFKLHDSADLGRSSNYAILPSFQDSGATGDEPLIPTGNDVLWGRNGKIETLVGVESFGDVEADDASLWISDQISEVTGWTAKYNSRTQKAFFWADDGNEIWVFHKSRFDALRRALKSRAGQDVTRGLSPWSKWTTDFGEGDFRQTAAELVRDPGDRVDRILFGDRVGRVFKLEGNSLQDGGTTDVVTFRKTPLIQALKGHVFNIKGKITYKKKIAATVTITAEWSGQGQRDDAVVVTIPAFSGVTVYKDARYYKSTTSPNYYGTKFSGRLQRQDFRPTGSDEFFQLKVSVTGAEFEIHEIELEFRPA